MFSSSTIQATPASKSLRLEIPPAIIQALDLRPGEALEWSLSPQGQMLLRRTTPAAAAPRAQKGARHC